MQSQELQGIHEVTELGPEKLVSGWPGEPHVARTDLIWINLNEGTKNQLYKNSGCIRVSKYSNIHSVEDGLDYEVQGKKSKSHVLSSHYASGV